jgi:hypothetical protein
VSVNGHQELTHFGQGGSVYGGHGHAAFLTDAREQDEFFYLLYAGSTETRTFSGRGDARLGLARNRDLVTWDVPLERE